GAGGPALVPGRPHESPLWQRVTSQDPAERMPPEGSPLSAEQLQRIEAWITQGAAGPANETPEPDPRTHWAFQSPVRPQVPALLSGATVHPIDAFIDATLSREGLTPAPPADKATLLRRVYLDLVGVPPTVEELRTFLADDSTIAYEQVVDRLLSDPRHGERWARHWLDIWRYSDWYGRRHVPDCWNSAPQIWRWRDWVVRSLNDDLGYDEMLRLMLAADEIAPEDPDAAVATGYLIRNWYALNPNDWMRSTVEHTGKAFLGLTFNCAHCHDHKYDPIAHDDYFRLRAFFEPIAIRQDRVPGQSDPGMFQEYSYGVLRKIQRNGAVRIFDKNPSAPTWFYTGGDERNRIADRGSIAPGVPPILGDLSAPIEPITLPPGGYYPGLQPAWQTALRTEAHDKVQAAQSAVDQFGNSAVEPDSSLVQALQTAEAAYVAAQQAADRPDRSGALEGAQSLLLDATAGRRILNNGLKSLTALTDGMTLEFVVQLQTNTHFNFQLAKDSIQGLTAGCVFFDQGKIQSYQPGGFSEFELGRYDFAAGQRRFRVTFEFNILEDRAYLSVVNEPDGQRLVDGVPVALNGWNPVGSAVMGVSFDARTGSVVVLDGVRLRPAASAISAIGVRPDPILSIDFEPPGFEVDRNLVGCNGWTLSSFSAPPATSVISAVALSTELQAARLAVQQAKRALRTAQLPRLAADARLRAAQSALAGLEARIAAEQARYQLITGADASSLAREASRLERDGAVLQAEADLLAAELSLATAEAKPAGDANRAKEIAAAQAALTAAQAAESKARTAQADISLAENYSPLSPIYPSTSTGRRKAFADWLVRRDHPLTPRVAVNHVWGWHFQRPLVSSVYDFGRNGALPTHPELLDWLAVEFVESGWSLRHLHRLIVTSHAYRRSSAVRERTANQERDPDNQSLWRMNVGRMEVEVVRDSLIAVAGKLDLTMRGQELENEMSLTTYRRSLYYSSHPEAGGKSPLGELFDAPDAIDCYRRTQTIIPQQALALTNSELVHTMAAAVVALAAPAPTEHETTELNRFVTLAFERVLSRAPTAAEREVSVAALKAQRDLLTREQAPDPLIRACESLVRVLFNHNDFVTIR
ncbi:MAG: PSD1 and planctomycete cytochrome C domain-containing protein, partial [Planctomycetaceae bacterium]|nr:PSD1 and planctomycete cytochrome C domain-containing protein [Planctomycetaceae bacterium]